MSEKDQSPFRQLSKRILRCPCCDVSLRPLKSYFECDCGAHWMPMQTLTEMVQGMQDYLGPSKLQFDTTKPSWFSRVTKQLSRGNEKKYQCPDCEIELTKVSYESVELDLCNRHGLLFEPGELQTTLQRSAENRPLDDKVNFWWDLFHDESQV